MQTNLKLLYTLSNKSGEIYDMAWSPDGRFLASSEDNTVRLWNIQTGQVVQTFTGHAGPVYSVVWSPNGLTLASCSYDGSIRLWEIRTGKLIHLYTEPPSDAHNIVWSPNGFTLASCSHNNSIQLYKAYTKETSNSLLASAYHAYCAAWLRNGYVLALSSDDKTIRLWDVQSGKLLHALTGHSGSITCLTCSSDGKLLASGSDDNTIRIWDIDTGRQIRILEGHLDKIVYLSFSSDSHLLVSQARDRTFLLWRVGAWDTIAQLDEHQAVPIKQPFSIGTAINPRQPILATLEKSNTMIHLWNVNIASILDTSPIIASVSYTNAKLVLLGDSGVGKSGLGLVLSGKAFALTESTHARRVWTFDNYEVNVGEGRKESRETLLWDLAGQPGYRLIHQLHLNEVAMALVVFDARSETEPFAGVQHWDRALRQAQRVQGSSALPLKNFLVAARIDRGSIGVSRERIVSLLHELSFDGYFETSAKEGWNIDKLREKIRSSIDWNILPKISSTELFQHIKTFLIEEKKAGQFLSRADDLYRTFLRSDDTLTNTTNLRSQFETCIGLVEATGLIKRLNFGQLILLQPELLDSYASALVNAVKSEPDGLGSIAEEHVRTTNFLMAKDERIKDKEQEKLLLIAMIEDLLRREIALREDNFLVFPSQSTRENPDLTDPEGKAVIFEFEGPVLNIYATLAVRLSRCGFFKKKDIWKNAITYTATAGGTCGMYLYNIGEGRGKLTIFFDKTEPASEETCFYFEEFVETHLQRRAIPESIIRHRIFICSTCSFLVTDQLVRLRAQRGFDFVSCPVCEKKISLIDHRQPLALPSFPVLEMDRTADGQRDREAAISMMQGKQETKDFDVFLCYHSLDKLAVKKVGEQLKEQGILPWLDEWELRPGLLWQRLLEEQIDHIKTAAVFVGRTGIGPWQEMELYAFLRQFVKRNCPVIPVILPECQYNPTLPPFLDGMTWVDFRQKEPNPMKHLIWGITGEKKEEH